MDTNLTREQARRRSATIALHTYAIELDLSEAPDPTRLTFPTRSTIVVTASAGETFLDFLGESVDEVIVNGVPQTISYDGAHVPLTDLVVGVNTIEVAATARYSTSGEGLHRYVDPADGRTYLYTHCEPSDARRYFVNLDQPDLKGAISVSVTAPAEWEVLSNQPVVATEEAPANAAGQPCARRVFSATPPLSTYLTCVAAGPYQSWSEEWSQGELCVPLRLFVRRSRAGDFDPEEVFTLTKQGLGYFHATFDYPYPWGKYDQIFVPEYNLGAMENPGLVTFNDEAYVFEPGATHAEHEKRSDTILHEMAHMWFGDLVTPRWWDDLWLKESFAEYMGSAATAEATEFTEAWTDFCAHRKAWAYRADQLVTTHPIAADIPDVEAARQNFDGITYAKGASVLRQLVAYVGREAFDEGSRRYFKRHAFGTTELADLLVELEAASGRDLAAWSRLWLHTSGLNTLTPELTCADGRIAALTIRQEDEAHPQRPVLRPHRLAVGLYSWVDGALRRTHRFELDVTEEVTTVAEALGLAEPSLVLVNDDDLTYAKVRLDPMSLATLEAHLSDVDGSLARAGAWSALWNACRDGLLPASRYVDLVVRHATREQHIGLVTDAIANAATAIAAYLPAGERPDVRRRFLEAAWSGMGQNRLGPDHQLAWARVFADQGRAGDVRRAETRALLEGSLVLAGLELAPGLRWRLWTALAATGSADQGDLDAARAADASSLAPVRHLEACASLPTGAAKGAAWERIMNDETLTNDQVSALAAGFSVPGQEALRADYLDRYFASLIPVWASRSNEIGQRIVEGLRPDAGDAVPGLAVAEHPVPAATRAWLDAHPDAPAALRRYVLEGLDDTERALRAQLAAVPTP